MKIGTIGTGFIVDRFINAVAPVDNVDCIAVYSRTQEKAEEYANKFGIEKAYCNMDMMLKDEDINTIYVASPNGLHFPNSLKALQAGKNVICEKPFASSVEELDILIMEAKKQNVFLWEAITNIYTPNLNIAKDLLNEVGNIRLVTCNFSQFSSRYNAFKNGDNPNVFNPEYSGGSIMDINVYNIHLVMYLFGKPNHYKYYANIAENGIDTSGTLIFEYDNFIATLIGAKDSASPNYACIQGDEGTLMIENASTAICKDLSFTKVNGESKNIGVDQRDHMCYEIMAFEAMYHKKDYATCHELLDYSREVLTIIETARKEAGIFFTADK